MRDPKPPSPGDVSDTKIEHVAVLQRLEEKIQQEWFDFKFNTYPADQRARYVEDNRVIEKKNRDVVRSLLNIPNSYPANNQEVVDRLIDVDQFILDGGAEGYQGGFTFFAKRIFDDIREFGPSQYEKLFIEKAKNGVMLDLGCGSPKHLLSYFDGIIKGYIGVDLNADLARKMTDPAQPDAPKNVTVAAIKDELLHFSAWLPTNSIPAIFMSGVDVTLIHSAEYFRRLFKQIERILVPDGLAYFKVCSFAGPEKDTKLKLLSPKDMVDVSALYWKEK